MEGKIIITSDMLVHIFAIQLSFYHHGCLFSSHQLAEEVLKSSPPPGEEEEESPGFEGMEALAKAIEQGISCSIQLIVSSSDSFPLLSSFLPFSPPPPSFL